MAMDIRKIRLENLKELMGDQKAVHFAERAGMNESHLSQILGGRSNMGDKLARKVEKNLNLDAYDLDKAAESKVGVNTDALTQIMVSVRAAVDIVGLNWSEQQIAQLTANLYKLYEKTGELPDIHQAVQLQVLQEQTP